MPAPEPTPLTIEEYRALRATIRERGTVRLIVAVITFVSWAALALVVAIGATVSPLALLPLVVLAAGFEATFALHVGVERIGRYVQVYFEGDSADPPQWEHLAMAAGAQASAGSGIDPLFSILFILAALLNLLPAALLSTIPSPELPGGLPAELTVYGLLHLLFIGRVLQARRFALGQRQRELQLFQRPR